MEEKAPKAEEIISNMKQQLDAITAQSNQQMDVMMDQLDQIANVRRFRISDHVY
jgi:hypothetical protein